MVLPADRRDGPVVWMVRLLSTMWPNWRGCFANSRKTCRLRVSLRTQGFPKHASSAAYYKGAKREPSDKAKKIGRHSASTD